MAKIKGLRFHDSFKNPTIDILNQNAKDLINKKLIPDYTIGHFDPQTLNTNFANWMISGVSNYKCKKCGIVIHGPKDWIVQHIKTHFKSEARENEEETVEVNPY